MKILDKKGVIKAAIVASGKPCLWLRVNYPDSEFSPPATLDSIIANAPYLAGEQGEDLLDAGECLVICETIPEAQALLEQTPCDNVTGGIYAALYDKFGECLDENT